MQVVRRDDLETLGLSDDEVHARSVRNFIDYMKTRKIETKRAPGLGMVTMGGDYESSLLVIPQFWRALVPQLGFHGPVIVAVPNKDVVMLADGSSSEAVGKLRAQAVNSYTSGSYPVTASLVQWIDPGWREVPGDP